VLHTSEAYDPPQGVIPLLDPPVHHRRAPAFIALCALLMSVVAAAPAPAAAPCTSPPPTFPTSQMTRGMAGIGYTVLEGDTVVPFHVQILGVMPDAIYLGIDIVVAKITGPPSFLDETGGAIAGMSGSPIYVKGKLAGALAWAIAEDRQIFGMTAAEDMLGLFSLGGAPSFAAPSTLALTPLVRRAARESDSPLASGASLEALPVPLGVSGTNGRRLAQVEDLFAEHGMRVSAFRAGSVPVPSGVTLDPRRFAPGEGFGVGLSYGDVSWYGFGTTTAVCGDVAIGFGHPMFSGTGRVALGMNAVDVIAIDNGTFWGTKIGVLGDAHGTMTQDRFSGVAGVFGALPATLPITSDVSSPDTGYGRTGRTEVAWDEDWFVAETAFSHAWSNLTYVVQEDAPGTLALSWTIEGTREDGSTWVVSNRFMEQNDYGAAAEAWRMSDMLHALASNGFEPIAFTSVSMDGSITGEDLTSRIVRVRVAGPLQPSLKDRGLVKAAPGDRLIVEVTLDPIERDTDVVTTLTVKVPRRARGYEQVRLSGGRGRLDYWGGGIGSLDDLIAVLNGGDHRNDLIVKGLGPTTVQPQEVIVTGKAGFTVKVVR